MRALKKHIAILASIPRHCVGGEALGRGGGQLATWLSQLAEKLVEEKDLQISWLTLDDAVSRTEIDETISQKFYRIPKGKMTLDIISGHFFARRKLLAALETIQPDIIHAWGTETSYPCVFGEVKVPTILSMQGILTEYRRAGVLDKNWRAQWQALYEKRWMRSADFVTAESLWALEKVKGIIHHERCKMVEYGVHPSFYEISWKPQPQEPAALFCGAVHYRKGIDVLCEAMELRKSLPSNWKLWIAGDGPLEASLHARQIPGIEWLGNLNWKELQDRLQRAWCLVIPTRGDTGPTVVKEARVVGPFRLSHPFMEANPATSSMRSMVWW